MRQALEISEATYHRWRNQYGGMKAQEAKRLKESKKENARLRWHPPPRDQEPGSMNPNSHNDTKKWGLDNAALLYINRILFYFPVLMIIKDKSKLLYFFVGALAFVVDFFVFISLNSFSLVFAQISARSIGAVIAFVGHKYVTFGNFDSRIKAVTQQSGTYVLLWFFSLGLSIFLIYFFSKMILINVLIAKFLTELIVLTINYVVMKNVIFKKKY